MMGDWGNENDGYRTSLFFGPDQSTCVLGVHAANDSLQEPTEWLKMVLLNATVSGTTTPVPLSSTLPTQAFGGILDDDALEHIPLDIAGSLSGAVEGQLISLSATTPLPFPGDVLSFNWQVTGNNQTIATGDTDHIEFVASNNGEYVVTVNATDIDSRNDTATLNFTVENAAPTADPLPDRTFSAGELAVISLPCHDSGPLDTHGASIDWGDGTFDSTSILESGGWGCLYADHAYLSAGLFSPVVTIYDSDGASVRITAAYTVTNAAPVLFSIANLTISEGGQATLAVPFTDNDPFDSHTASVDWGDGTIESAAIFDSSAAGTITASHLYPQDGLYTATLTLTDGSNTTDSRSAVVAVANVAPRADAGSVHRGVTGEEMVIPGQFFDPGELDEHTFAWQLRDSLGNLILSATTQDLTFTPFVAGTYFATFTVTDDGPTSSTGSATTRILIGNPGDPINTSTPNAPTGLTVGSVSPDAITLSWLDQSSDEDGFSIEWSPDGTDYYCIDAVPAGVTSYTDHFPLLNGANHYQVSAFRDAQDSEPTEPVTGTPHTATVAFYDDNAGYNERDTLSPFSVIHGQTFNGSVFGNDVDFSSLAFSVASETDPEHGTLELNEDGTFAYTPNAGFIGTDQFTYTVDNGFEVSAPATVAIDVTNDKPKANESGAEIAEAVHNGQLLSWAGSGSLSGDDYDGDVLQYRITRAPHFGTIQLDPESGDFFYIAGPNYAGYDSFTWVANDGFADSDASLATLTNTAYSLVGQSRSILAFAGETTTFTPWNNGQWQFAKTVEHGTLILDEERNANGSGHLTVHYTPNAGFHGSDSFALRDQRRAGGPVSKPVVFTFEVVDNMPTCFVEGGGLVHYVVSNSGISSFTRTYTGFVPLGVNGTVTVSHQAEHGTVNLDSAGGFTYTARREPDGEPYHGRDFFAFIRNMSDQGPVEQWVELEVVSGAGTVDAPETFPPNLQGAWQAHLSAKDKAIAVVRAVEQVGAKLSAISALTGDPTDRQIDELLGAVDNQNDLYNRYVQQAVAAHELATEFMKSIWFTTDARAAALRAINELPITFLGVERTKEQAQQWTAALKDFSEGAAVMVSHNDTVVKFAERAQKILNAAQMALGVGAMITTGAQLITQKGCAEFTKWTAKTLINMAIANEINSMGTQLAIGMARKLGIDVDEHYIQAAVEGVQLIFLIKAARAQRKAMNSQCFVGDTEVLTDSKHQPNVFADKKIQDIRAGDLVWSRDQGNPDAPLELKQVKQVFRHIAYDLQSVSLTNATGHTQTIHVTDSHPFFIEGRGWTDAAALQAGDHVESSNGDLIVSGNEDEKHTSGIAVFNFEVEADHTYFVSAAGEANAFAWVHNACYTNQNPDTDAPQIRGREHDSKVLRRNLEKAGVNAPAPGEDAAHHIVAGGDQRAADALAKLQRNGIDVNEAANGVFLPRYAKNASPPSLNHGNLHTDRYHREVSNRINSASESREALLDVLSSIRQQLTDGSFPYK